MPPRNTGSLCEIRSPRRTFDWHDPLGHPEILSRASRVTVGGIKSFACRHAAGLGRECNVEDNVEALEIGGQCRNAPNAHAMWLLPEAVAEVCPG